MASRGRARRLWACFSPFVTCRASVTSFSPSPIPPRSWATSSAWTYNAERQMAQLQLDRLQDEARLGSQTAALEARKLEVAQEYADKRREIVDLLKEEALTDQQRSDALSNLASLDQRESAAM